MEATNSKRHEEDKLEETHWPQDVIQGVLARLPIKSILRFKSTCRTWYDLIRSRSFIQLHRRFHLHDDRGHQLFFFCGRGKHSFVVYTTYSSCSNSISKLFDVGALLKSLKAVTHDEIRLMLTRFGIELPKEMIAQVYEPNINVLGPLSNGIYCVVAQVYVRTSNYTTYGYSNSAFCNPATGEFKLITPPHVFKLTSPWPVTRRSYAKQVLEVKQHYGFCSIQKGSSDVVVDYKMVMIIQKLEWFLVFVYSLRRGSWQVICDSECRILYRKTLAALVNRQNGKVQFPAITQDLDFLPQAFLKGSCHWMAEHNSVLQFDMTNEVFGLIAGPPDDFRNHPNAWVKRGVYVLKDHLAAIIIHHGPDFEDNIDRDVDVWMMKEYGFEKSWTKIHSCKFQFEGKLQKFLGMFFSGDSHGITIEKMFFQVKQGMLLSYDCSGHILKKCSTSDSSSSDCSGHILEKHCTLDSSLSCWTTMEEDDGDDSSWACLKTMKDDGYDSSWSCWKTIGLSAYVETLEPVVLESSEHEKLEAWLKTLGSPMKSREAVDQSGCAFYGSTSTF